MNQNIDSNVIWGDFPKMLTFTGEIYSDNRKKYRFTTTSSSVERAFFQFIAMAQDYGVGMLLCVAVYSGYGIDFRYQSPVKIWMDDKLGIRA